MRNLYLAKNEDKHVTAIVHAVGTVTAEIAVRKFEAEGRWEFAKISLGTLDETVQKLFAEGANCCINMLTDDKDDLRFQRGLLIEKAKDYLMNGRDWTLNIYVATEADGLDTRNMVMVMKAADGVDIKEAATAACTEYCKTEEGKATYEGNCCCFNWGDLDTYVPNDICRKYGFEKVDSNVVEEFAFDEQLVNEFDIFPEE